MAKRAMGHPEVLEGCAGGGSFFDGLSGDKPWGVGLKGDVVPNVHDAFNKALSLAGTEDMVFVGREYVCGGGFNQSESGEKDTEESKK